MQKLCQCCYARPATRQAIVDGDPVRLCETCPDESEIRQRAEAIRDAWPNWRREQASRRDETHGFGVELLAYTVRQTDRGPVAKSIG